MSGYFQMVYKTAARRWTAEVWIDRETFEASQDNGALRPLAVCDHAHRTDLAAISCASKMRRDLEQDDRIWAEDDAELRAMGRIEDSWA